MRGHIVMLVRNGLAFDTRVKKEAASLAAAGFRVTVLARKLRDLPEREEVGGATVLRIRGVPRLDRVERGRRWLRRLAGTSVDHIWWTHLGYRRSARGRIRELQPDAVHAHDLNTLHAALGAGVPVVYDAHELELARRRYPGPLARAADRAVERRGIRAAAARITVSEGIARELAQTYGVPEPTVILNSPSLTTRDQEPAVDLRAGLPADAELAVYVGKVLLERAGLEQLVEALPESFHAGFLGPPPADDARAALSGARVHWFDAVPYAQVPATLRAATCTVIPLQNVHRSYDLALPNKLFDSIMAGVPIGVSRLEEASRLVRGHGIGVVFDETSPASIAAALEELAELRRDPGLAARFAALQEEIAWERQEAKLVALYEGLLG